MDHVAVFHFFRGQTVHNDELGEQIQVQASVPYISSASRFRFPFQQEFFHPEYREKILHDVLTLSSVIFRADRSSSDPIDPGDKAAIYNPKRHPTIPIGERTRYRRLLVDCAESITRQLGLDDYIFKFLFSLQGQVQLIQICTNERDIPWDWIYCREKDKFLCEMFGVGVTFPETKRPLSRYRQVTDYSVTEEKLASGENTALLVANTYAKTNQPMHRLGDATEELGNFLKEPFGPMAVKVLKNAKREEMLDAIVERAETLRLLCLSGHFTNEGFRTSLGKNLDRDALVRSFGDLYNEPLEARPIVILNGCRSAGTGSSSLSNQMGANRDLARAFLELGAGACIITSTDVRLQYSIQFINGLVKRLLQPNTTLGTALLETRNSFEKDKCYEWATFHLQGDPSYVMVRE